MMKMMMMKKKKNHNPAHLYLWITLLKLQKILEYKILRFQIEN